MSRCVVILFIGQTVVVQCGEVDTNLIWSVMKHKYIFYNDGWLKALSMIG